MSEIKECIVSRFGDNGYILEADLSQIEIVVLAYLSGDKNMIADIVNGVDFHCKRAAKKIGISYGEMYHKCHVEKSEAHSKYRKKAKQFSFQRSYGAGAPAIAESTGMSVEEVKEFIRAEEEMYPDVVKLQQSWIEEVERNARYVTDDGGAIIKRTTQGLPAKTGKLNSLTGRQYTFYEEDSPEWMRRAARPKLKGFRPTQIKNYPIQGFAGEILRLILGKLFRTLKNNPVLCDNALLVNTVHDSILLDIRKEYLDIVAKTIKDLIESAGKLIEEKFGFKMDVPVTCDIEYGPNWLNMKEWKENNGH